MKHLVFITLILISCIANAKPPVRKARVTIPASSMTVTQLATDSDGLIRISNQIQCDAREPRFCMQICNSIACKWTESYCRDCFGSSSVVMHEIFTRLLPTYRPVYTTDVRAEIETLISGFMTGSLLLVPLQSPYDFFNSSQDPGLAPHLKNLCGSENGFVAVQTDEDARPVKAVFVVCATSIGLIATTLRRSDDPATGHTSDPLHLKLTTEINLRKP